MHISARLGVPELARAGPGSVAVAPKKATTTGGGRAPARSQGVQHAGIIGDIAGLAVSVIGLSDCPHEFGSEPNFPLFLVPRKFGKFGKFNSGLPASGGMRERRLHRPFV